MNIGALIPIRLSSERLPGKALMDLCERPVFAHLLDRVAACKHIESTEDIVVCTTGDTSDDALEDAVRAYGASIFRGSADDIIDRFGAAMAQFDFDLVIQADGDDPLSATEYMNLTVDKLLATPGTDIVTVQGLPLGTATKSFTREAMQKVLGSYKTEKNDTGFIYFFTKTGLCNHLEISPISPDHVLDAARLTLDYEIDLKLFRNIFEALYEPGQLFSLDQVVRYLLENPDLVKSNLCVEEEYWRRTADKAVLEFTSTNGETKIVPV
jgi:spore coat polysaccharide biosynthesis protein SpsF (cytidylyltransferase family)